MKTIKAAVVALKEKIKARIKSWFSKKAEKIISPEPEKPKNPNCGCTNLSSPLCDPNPAKYTQDYMDANGRSEECNIEPSTGLLVRYEVLVPSRGFWWMLSTLGLGYVSRDGSTLVAPCHSKDGYRYHVRGFSKDEPQRGNLNPALINEGNTTPYNGGRKYILVECRKENT